MSSPRQRCADCGNTVDDAPRRITSCVKCGGSMEIVTDTEPEPPDVAAYVLDALDRQSADALRAIADYAQARADWLDRPVDPEEIPVDDAEEIVDSQPSSGSKGTIVEKKIPCGKNCGGCPHGPYKYRVWREGDSVKTEYLGTAD